MSNFPIQQPSLPNPGPFLQIQKVVKTYKLGRTVVEVLREVDLTVEKGECLAILGASGAGKSTLLHLLGGLDKPDSGQIIFAGRQLETMSEKELAVFRNRMVGFVFQFYCLLPELDALENVALPARLARRPAPEAYTQATQLLTRVGLHHRLKHKPSELSGGEQQRVAIARALINNPQLILADEPTGNLDSKTGLTILDLLRELQREKGVTLILATHDASVAARANRVVELVDGQIRF